MNEYNQQQISAYLDAELSDKEAQKTRLWLAQSVEAQALLTDIQWQREQLHSEYDQVLDEPIPGDMLRIDTGKQRIVWRQIAASVIVFVFGFASAWQLKPNQIDFNSTQAKVQGALNAHALYAKEHLHAVEVKAEVEHLMPWLSARIGRELKAPVFSDLGYDFLGGRLMTEGGLAAALLMYQDSKGQRISLYISSSDYSGAAALYKNEQLNSFIWQNNQSTFILVGELKEKMLKDLARQTNRQIQRF